MVFYNKTHYTKFSAMYTVGGDAETFFENESFEFSSTRLEHFEYKKKSPKLSLTAIILEIFLLY